MRRSPNSDSNHYEAGSVKATYVKVLIVQAVVLAGLWFLQQAFL